MCEPLPRQGWELADMPMNNGKNPGETCSALKPGRHKHIAALLSNLYSLSRNDGKASEESLYGEILKSIQSFFGIAAVTLSKQNPTDGTIRYVAVAAHSPEMRAAYDEKRKVGREELSIRRMSLIADKPVYFADTAAAEHPELFAAHTKCSFCVPFATDFGERWFISADHTLPDAITPADREVIILCSEILRNLVESARSRHVLTRMSDAFREVSSLALQASVEAVCAAITDVIVEAVGAYACSVILRPDGDRDDLVLAAERNINRVLPDGRRLPFELKVGEGVAGRVIKETNQILVYDLGVDDQFADKELVKFNKLGSVLSMPLVAQGRTVGAVGYYTHQDNKHAFSQMELAQLRTLVGLCGVALGLASAQRALLDSLECGVCILRKDFRLVFANRYQKELFPEVGRELEMPLEARHRKCYELYHGASDFADKCPWCPVDRVLEDGMPHALITHADARFQHMGHYYTAAASLTTEGELTTSIMEMVTDVTSQVEQLVLAFLMVEEDDWRRLLDLAADSLCRLTRVNGCVVLAASPAAPVLRVVGVYFPEGENQFVQEMEYLLKIPPEQFMHRIADYAQHRGLQFRRADKSWDVAVPRSELCTVLGSPDPHERAVSVSHSRLTEARSLADLLSLFDARSAKVVCITEVSPTIYVLLLDTREDTPSPPEVAMEAVAAAGDVIASGMAASVARRATGELAGRLETVAHSIDDLMLKLHDKSEAELEKLVVRIALGTLDGTIALLALADESSKLVMACTLDRSSTQHEGEHGQYAEYMRVLEGVYATKHPSMCHPVVRDEHETAGHMQASNVSGCGNCAAMYTVPLIAQDGGAIGALGVVVRPTGKLAEEVASIPSDSCTHLLRLVADAYVAAATNVRAQQELSNAKDKLLARMEDISNQIGRATFWAWTRSVNHDVKNLLFEVETELKELCETGKFSSRDAGMLRRVLQRTGRVREQIREVLALWRDERVDRWSQDINDLVRHGIRLSEHQRLKSGKSVGVDTSGLSPQLPLVSVAPAEIVLTVYNLLTNAIRAVQESDRREGWVRVRTRYESGEIYIEVEDNGTGIPNEIVGRIFEPNFTTSKDGTGIGLYSVVEIAKSYGGSAYVAKHTVGQGSTFVVRLRAV